MAFLQLKNIESGYGPLKVVKGISFSVAQRDILALVGPNGAGKSTVLKTIFGLVKATRGSVIFDGRDITNNAPDALGTQGIGFVPQGRRVFAEMSVEENLEMGGFLLSGRAEIKNRLADVYLIFPILKEKRKQRAMLLSGGQQQMLSIARALMMEPKLLLVDRPSMGLSPKVVQEIFALLVEIGRRGTALIVVEQNARQALKICTACLVLEQGKVALSGGRELLKDKRIQQVYLGHGR